MSQQAAEQKGNRDELDPPKPLTEKQKKDALAAAKEPAPEADKVDAYTPDREAAAKALKAAQPKHGAVHVIEKTLKKLSEFDLVLAEFARPAYRVLVSDPDITLAEICRPEYWANVGLKLKGNGQYPFAIIEMMWADGTRYVELCVVDSGPQWAKVKVLRDVDMTQAMDEVQQIVDQSPDAGYEVKYKGPALGWCVIRLKDNQRMTEKNGTKGDAQKWLTDYLKALK